MINYCGYYKDEDYEGSIRNGDFVISSDGKTLIDYEGGLVEEVNLPEGVTEIGNGLFATLGSIRKIEIPDSITKIGYEAFRRCNSLESIKLSKNLESIGEKAFVNCRSLESIKLPKV